MTNQNNNGKSEYTKAGKLRKVSKKEQRRRLEESRLALRRAREANLDKWAGKTW